MAERTIRRPCAPIALGPCRSRARCVAAPGHAGARRDTSPRAAGPLGLANATPLASTRVIPGPGPSWHAARRHGTAVPAHGPGSSPCSTRSPTARHKPLALFDRHPDRQATGRSGPSRPAGGTAPPGNPTVRPTRARWCGRVRQERARDDGETRVSRLRTPLLAPGSRRAHATPAAGRARPGAAEAAWRPAGWSAMSQLFHTAAASRSNLLRQSCSDGFESAAAPRAAPPSKKWSMHRIRLTLAGFTLPCGCVGGIYETYSGAVVRLLDVRGSRCSLEQHRPGAEIDGAPDTADAAAERGTSQPDGRRPR